AAADSPARTRWVPCPIADPYQIRSTGKYGAAQRTATVQGDRGRHRSRHDPSTEGRGHSHLRGLAAGPEVADLPTVVPGRAAQGGGRIDRDGPTDRAQHGYVVDGVAVRGAAGQVEPLPNGQLGDRGGLGRPVHHVADQSARVATVLDLGDRADGPGQ